MAHRSGPRGGDAEIRRFPADDYAMVRLRLGLVDLGDDDAEIDEPGADTSAPVSYSTERRMLRRDRARRLRVG